MARKTAPASTDGPGDAGAIEPPGGGGRWRRPGGLDDRRLTSYTVAQLGTIAGALVGYVQRLDPTPRHFDWYAQGQMATIMGLVQLTDDEVQDFLRGFTEGMSAFTMGHRQRARDIFAAIDAAEQKT